MRTYTVYTSDAEGATAVEVPSSAPTLERLLDDIHTQTGLEPREVLWMAGGAWVPLAVPDCHVASWPDPPPTLKVLPLAGIEKIVAPDVHLNFVGRERLAKLLSHVKLDKSIAGHVVLRVRDGDAYTIARLHGVNRDATAGLQLFVEVASSSGQIIADFRSIETVSNKPPSKQEVHHWVKSLHATRRRVPTDIEIKYSTSVVNAAEQMVAEEAAPPAPVEPPLQPRNSHRRRKSSGDLKVMDVGAPDTPAGGAARRGSGHTRNVMIMIDGDDAVVEMATHAATVERLFDDIHAKTHVEPKAVLRQAGAGGEFTPLAIDDCCLAEWADPVVLKVIPLKGMEKVVLPELNLNWVGRDRLVKLLGDPLSSHGPMDKIISGHVYLRLRDGDAYAIGCLRGVMRDTQAGVKLFVEVVEGDRVVGDLRSLETVSNKAPGRVEIHQWAMSLHNMKRRIPTELELEYSGKVLQMAEDGGMDELAGSTGTRRGGDTPQANANTTADGTGDTGATATPDERGLDDAAAAAGGGGGYARTGVGGTRGRRMSSTSPTTGVFRRRLSADLFANVGTFVPHTTVESPKQQRRRHRKTFLNPILPYPTPRAHLVNQQQPQFLGGGYGGATASPTGRMSTTPGSFRRGSRGCLSHSRGASPIRHHTQAPHPPPTHGDVYEAPSLTPVKLHPRAPGGSEPAYLLTFTRVTNQSGSRFAPPSAHGHPPVHINNFDKSCATQLISKHFQPKPYSNVDVTPKGTGAPSAPVLWHGLHVMCYERWGRKGPKRQFYHMLSRDGVHWGAASPRRLYTRARGGGCGDAGSAVSRRGSHQSDGVSPRWSVNDRRRSSTPPPHNAADAPPPPVSSSSYPVGGGAGGDTAGIDLTPPNGSFPRAVVLEDAWGGEPYLHLFWVERNPLAVDAAPPAAQTHGRPTHARKLSSTSLQDALNAPLSPDVTSLAARAGKVVDTSAPAVPTLAPAAGVGGDDAATGNGGAGGPDDNAATPPTAPFTYIVKHAVSTDPELKHWRREGVLEGVGAHDPVVGMSVAHGVPEGLSPLGGRERVAPTSVQRGVTLVLSTVRPAGTPAAAAPNAAPDARHVSPQRTPLRKSRTVGQLGSGYLRNAASAGAGASPAPQGGSGVPGGVAAAATVTHTAFCSVQGTGAQTSPAAVAFTPGIPLLISPTLHNPAHTSDTVEVASDCSLCYCTKAGRWYLFASCVTRASAPYSTVLAFTSQDHREWTAVDFGEPRDDSDDDSSRSFDGDDCLPGAERHGDLSSSSSSSDSDAALCRRGLSDSDDSDF